MIAERINIFNDKEQRFYVFLTEKEQVQVKIDKGRIFVKRASEPQNTSIPEPIKPKKTGFFSKKVKDDDLDDKSLSNSLKIREDVDYFERI